MAQSEFERRVIEHPTFRYVQEGLLLASQIEDSPEKDQDEENVRNFARIKVALEEIKARLEASMLLVTVAALDQLRGSVEVLVEALRQYKMDKGYPLQNTASSHVDQVIAYLLLIPSPPVIARRLAPTLTRLRKELDDSANNLRTEVQGIQKQFHLDATEAQTNLNDIRNQSQEFLDARQTAFDRKYSEIEEKVDIAKDMLNAMSGYALGNQYEDEMERQNRQEKRWTIAGYLLAGLLVTTSGVLFAAPLFGWVEYPGSIAEGIGRFLQQSPLFGGLTAAVTLVFRKASYHRQKEAEATRLRNELMMLRAFIESLPPDEQTAVLTLIAPRYFVGNSVQTATNDEIGIADTLQRILRKRDARDVDS